MAKLDVIKAPIADELVIFEKNFREAMKSNVPLLDRVMYYIVQRKGKQVRPMFVLLSARLHGEIAESTYTAASLIELLHTATLVHDDVVDDALERRGFFSVNALWKNKIAVLVGDYLLAKGLLLSLDRKEHRMLQITSNAVKEMSDGELLQMEKARKLDIREEVYFDIIRKKTASLIAAACSAGTASVSSDETLIERMRHFGELIGIAFQIKDDILDYGEADIGKPTGIDIKERKMTLPLIYALSQTTGQRRRAIMHTVKNNNNDPAKIREVIAFVQQSGGIQYATEQMHHYQQQAFDLLATMPQGETADALRQLVEFTTQRKK